MRHRWSGGAEAVRAVRFRAFGGPEVLRVEDVPPPGPPTGDRMLVRVDASSVNGTDLGLRRGDLRIATVGRMPFVPGFDVAGEVLRCGPAVTAFAPGDRIVALIGHGGGGQAEHIVIRQGRAALAPPSSTPAEAAALPLAGLTALQALFGRAGLGARPRARVLINGATGGIGSFGVQLAKLAGAHVTAVGSAARLDLATELGADQVIDRSTRDVTALGERWDVVFDAAGTLTLPAMRSSLTRGSVLVTVRPLSRDTLRALAPRWSGAPRVTAVMTSPRSQDLARLCALVTSGRLRAVVDRVYPVYEIAAAHRHVQDGVRGKVVVTFG